MSINNTKIPINNQTQVDYQTNFVIPKDATYVLSIKRLLMDFFLVLVGKTIMTSCKNN